MAIHELSTNSGKYGALTNGEGNVDVVWDVDRDEAGAATFVISWAESNGPCVSLPSRRGFGFTVIFRLAEASLAAKVELDYAKSGFFWRLECAAAKVLGL
jgi:two-component sensor histidine kinase